MFGAAVILRVLHIAATCTSLGGLFYARAVLWPALEVLPEPARAIFLRRAIRRFAVVKWTGVAVVVATGIAQWVRLYPAVADRPLYLCCFGLKMAGAAGLFSITLMLALPAEAFAGMQRRRAFWAGLNVACGVTILVGAALMRAVR